MRVHGKHHTDASDSANMLSASHPAHTNSLPQSTERTAQKTHSQKRKIGETQDNEHVEVSAAKRIRLEHHSQQHVTIRTETIVVSVHKAPKVVKAPKTLTELRDEVREKFITQSKPIEKKAAAIWFVGGKIKSKMDEGKKWLLEQLDAAESIEDIITALKTTKKNMEENTTMITLAGLGEDFTQGIDSLNSQISELQKHPNK